LSISIGTPMPKGRRRRPIITARVQLSEQKQYAAG
jgi:hypothetical protein